MVALSAIIMQVIRYRLEQLYRTTIGVRLFFIACIIWFYVDTRDPVFLMMLGVVGLGEVMTISFVLYERYTNRGQG